MRVDLLKPLTLNQRRIINFFLDPCGRTVILDANAPEDFDELQKRGIIEVDKGYFDNKPSLGVMAKYLCNN